MNIAILTSRYPKENDPYRHMFVHVRALYFKEQRVNVTVFVPSKYKETYNYQGVDVVCDSSKNICKVLHQYDLLYLHLLNFYPKVDGGYAIYKKIVKRKWNVALFIHGADVLKYPDYLYDFRFTPLGIAKFLYFNYWNHYWMKFFLNKIDKSNRYLILTPSKWMKAHTESIFKRKFHSFYNLPNGIDTDLFNLPSNFENRFKAVTIRPLSDPKYGVDTAIEVMKQLPKEFTLDIYGKGYLSKKYQKMIDDYDMQDRVQIIDTFIERNAINDLFSKYGMFFAFTNFDSQGVIMCEAMASRLLTVSNPIAAIPEFIQDGITGLLGNDFKEIAEKIVAVTNDQEIFEGITQNARVSMEQIHWRSTGEKELKLLRKLVEE